MTKIKYHGCQHPELCFISHQVGIISRWHAYLHRLLLCTSSSPQSVGSIMERQAVLTTIRTTQHSILYYCMLLSRPGFEKCE